MVAVRPGTSPADPRVACPVCGGLIHPIAGRCKHCKSDLSALRTNVQSGPVALAPLGAAAAAPFAVPPSGPHAALPAYNGYAGYNGSNGHGNGHAGLPPLGQGAAAMPMAATVVAPGGVVRPASAWSRRWPIVVVILAAVAIVVSIVLLLKDDDPKSSKVHHGIQPSMDNTMNTNPMIPSDPDPWGQPPSLAPQAPPPPDPGGITGGITGGGSSTNPIGAPPRERFMKAMYTTMCERMRSCGAPSGAAAMDAFCSDSFMDTLDSLSANIDSMCPNYNAAKASACLTKLASFPCVGSGSTWDTSQMYGLISGFSECTETCQ